MDGVFATMLIVLPSAFEGGEIRSSYAHRSTVLDVSRDSIHNTSVIAWYADAVMDATKFTSGSPLVLSYSLIYPSPTMSPPGRYKCHGGQALLVECLRGWREGKMSIWGPVPKTQLVAYTLSNCYSKEEIGKGLAAMRGIDVDFVHHVARAAGSMGYVVCLGSVMRGPPSFERHCFGRTYGHKITGVVYIDGSSNGWFDDKVFVDKLDVIHDSMYRCMYCNDQYSGRGHNLIVRLNCLPGYAPTGLTLAHHSFHRTARRLPRKVGVGYPFPKVVASLTDCFPNSTPTFSHNSLPERGETICQPISTHSWLGDQ